MDPKVLESWLRLTADALRGTEDARKAMETLGANPLTPEALTAWARAWMPREAAGAPDADAAALKSLVEEYWKTLGVVPRQRYLELLEKYEELKSRLEEAETTVKHLRELLAARGRGQEAEGAIGDWEEVTRKALQTQAEWAQSWTEGFFSAADKKKRNP